MSTIQERKYSNQERKKYHLRKKREAAKLRNQTLEDMISIGVPRARVVEWMNETPARRERYFGPTLGYYEYTELFHKEYARSDEYKALQRRRKRIREELEEEFPNPKYQR